MRVEHEKFQEACEILREKVTINTYLEKQKHVHFKLGDTDKMIRCPFPDHNDSTPSFSYNLDKQLFNCFGCSRGGDVINLHYHFKEIEDERYTKVKAVRELARLYGVTIPDMYKEEMKVGKVNKYKRARVDLKNLPDGFYKEKIKGFENIIRNIDVERRIKIYRWIDDMYLGEKDAKEVFGLIRGEMR